jgi:anti-sigma-K factor RskA
MMRELTHDEAFAALDAAALDVLEGSERAAVLTHIEGCSICKAELETIRSTVANLAFSTALAADTPTASRSRIRRRLLERATAEPKPDASARLTPTVVTLPIGTVVQTPDQASPPNGVRAMRAGVARTGWRAAEWTAMAAGILLAASLGIIGAMWQERGRLHDEIDEQTVRARTAIASTDSLRAALSARDSLLGGLTGRDVAVMTLTSSAARSPFARMFWDQSRNTWTLVAHNLPPLKPGRTYQLWLVTKTAKISAGTFAERNGDAVVRATYALPPEELRALAVTEEPAGGAPQPTSAPLIAATATR